MNMVKTIDASIAIYLLFALQSYEKFVIYDVTCWILARL